MIIAKYYPDFSGAEKQLKQLMDTQTFKKNVDCIVLTRRRKGLSAYQLINEIPVYRVLTLGSGKLASLTFTFFGFLWLLRNRHRFDILHCHSLHSPSTIGLLGKFFL